MLEVERLSAGYGEVQILRNVSLSVASGDMVTLVGSNGAGKSTLLNTICGILRPSAGRVVLDGKDITGWSSEAIVAEGVTQVPEGRRLFPQMTVRENLLIGAYRRRDPRGVERDIEWMYELFPILRERLDAFVLLGFNGGETSGAATSVEDPFVASEFQAGEDLFAPTDLGR